MSNDITQIDEAFIYSELKDIVSKRQNIGTYKSN